jgi:hypothetical protein
MTGSAEFSPDGRYRYTLTREIAGCDGPPELYLMLNPSKANANRNDQTMSKVMGFATVHNACRVRVGNPFALVATKPADLRAAIRHNPVDAVGPENDWHLQHLVDATIREGGKLIAAWGDHGFAQPRINEMVTMLDTGFPDIEWWCLAHTANGSPRHPLYLAYESRPRRWRRPPLDGRG